MLGVSNDIKKSNKLSFGESFYFSDNGQWVESMEYGVWSMKYEDDFESGWISEEVA